MALLSKLMGSRERPDPIGHRMAVLPGFGPISLARSVNCMGTMCPRPQLLAAKILSEVAPGDVIEVVSDNPGAVEAFPALAETLACDHLLTVREHDGWRVYLRKGLQECAPDERSVERDRRFRFWI